jgi:hypothetical protein
MKAKRREEEERSLHCAAGARVRERRKKPTAPVGMTGLGADRRVMGSVTQKRPGCPGRNNRDAKSAQEGRKGGAAAKKKPS